MEHQINVRNHQPDVFSHIFIYVPMIFPNVVLRFPIGTQKDELEDLVERRMSMGSNGSTSMIQNMTWGCPKAFYGQLKSRVRRIFGAVMMRIMVMMMMISMVINGY